MLPRAGFPGPSKAAGPAEFRAGASGLVLRLAGPARALAQRVAAWRHFDLVVVLSFSCLAIGLRWRGLWASYWGDEAIAIGIAAQPLGSLPHYLANDGSPPLYYAVLHYWMDLFGRSEVATHALSLLGAVAAVPCAWWSGLRLFGPWAGRAAAAMVATCAYLDYYATDTRMYSWLVVEALLAVTCFVLAYQGAERHSGRYWAAAVGLTTATLYTQYYGLYLLFALVVVGSVAAVRERAADRLQATLLFGLACSALFAPWLPQFISQVLHTGAPWAPHPLPVDFVVDTFNAMASAGWAGVLVALAIALCATSWVLHPGHLKPLMLMRARPSGLAMAAAVPVVLLVTAWVGAQVVNSWDSRYLGIAVIPVLVALAGGLARARLRLFGAACAVVAMTATALPMLVDRALTVETSKSDAAYLLDQLRPLLEKGALVISADVTDTPVLALDLGGRYRYATAFGRVPDPLVVDWADLPTRLQRVNAATNLGHLIASVPVGGQVLLVNPSTWGGGEVPERYAGPVEAEGIAANQLVAAEPDLLTEVTLQVPSYSAPLYPMTVILFVKVAGAQPAR